MKNADKKLKALIQGTSNILIDYSLKKFDFNEAVVKILSQDNLYLYTRDKPEYYLDHNGKKRKGSTTVFLNLNNLMKVRHVYIYGK